MSHEYSMVYRSLNRSVNLPVSKLPVTEVSDTGEMATARGRQKDEKSYKRTINHPSIIKLSIQRQSFTIHRIF